MGDALCPASAYPRLPLPVSFPLLAGQGAAWGALLLEDMAREGRWIFSFRLFLYMVMKIRNSGPHVKKVADASSLGGLGEGKISVRLKSSSLCLTGLQR